MTKYKKKPVVIEAEQLTAQNAVALVKWCGGQLWDDPEEGGYFVLISTLEGDMKCFLDDWIIKGIKGEFYPCKPDIFEKTYEKEENETQNAD